MERKVKELEDRESQILSKELEIALLNPIKEAEFTDPL